MVIIEIIVLLIELVILAVIWGDRKDGNRLTKSDIEYEGEEHKEEQLRKDWNEGMTNMMAFTYEDAIKAAREEREHGKL